MINMLPQSINRIISGKSSASWLLESHFDIQNFSRARKMECMPGTCSCACIFVHPIYQSTSPHWSRLQTRLCMLNYKWKGWTWHWILFSLAIHQNGPYKTAAILNKSKFRKCSQSTRVLRADCLCMSSQLEMARHVVLHPSWIASYPRMGTRASLCNKAKRRKHGSMLQLCCSPLLVVFINMFMYDGFPLLTLTIAVKSALMAIMYCRWNWNDALNDICII